MSPPQSIEIVLKEDNWQFYILATGERYDFVINADQPAGAYWIQLRSLGECGIPRAQQLAILRYARGPYQPSTAPPTYDFGLPQGVVSIRSLSLLLRILDLLAHNSDCEIELDPSNEILWHPIVVTCTAICSCKINRKKLTDENSGDLII